MRKKFTVILLLVVTAGCGRGDPELQLNLSDIKILCDDVGNKAFAEMNARDSNRPNAAGFAQVQAGATAQCELEYRIKQQEANNTFLR